MKAIFVGISFVASMAAFFTFAAYIFYLLGIDGPFPAMAVAAFAAVAGRSLFHAMMKRIP